MPERLTELGGSLLAVLRHAAGGLFFTFTHPGERAFIGWLLLFAVMVLVLRRRTGNALFLAPVQEDEPGVGLLARAFPKRLWLSRSARVDYKFFFMDRLTEFFILSSAVLSSSVITGALVEQVSSKTSYDAAPFSAGPGVMLAYGLFSLLAYDVGYFLGHYLGHKVPVLWEFHKLHHVAEVLTPATSFREHPVDKFVTGSCFATTVGLSDAVFVLLFGPEVRFFELMGMNVLFIPYYLVVSFRHSHVWIGFGPVLSKWFSSPCMHQIHHSRDERHWDTNFCQIFSCIDRAAGTLYVPSEKEEIEFGVPDYRGRMNESLLAAYVEPFVGVWRLLTGASPRVDETTK